MTIDFDNRPFWKPRDLAELLSVSRSAIYRLIEDGTLAHVKVGQRTIRVPAASVAAYLGRDAPVTSPQAAADGAHLEARGERFTARTGRTPEQYIAAWRRGEIADTADENQNAMEALALREAGVGSHTVASA